MLATLTTSSSVTIDDILRAFDPTGMSSPDAQGTLVGLATAFFVMLLALTLVAMIRAVRLWLRTRRLRQTSSTIRSARVGVRATIAEWRATSERLSSDHTPEWIRAPFSEFSEQVWLDEETDHARNEEQAEDYFDEEVLDPGFRWTTAVPGMLTATGILGTFLGITIGLSLVGGSLTSADALEGGISSLIKALGVSFRTSIWGLLLSIVADATLSYCQHKLDDARLQFVAELNQTVLRGTPIERLLRSNVRLEATSAATRELNEQIVTALAELTRLGEAQKAEIQGLGETIAQSFEEAIFGRPDRAGLVGVLESSFKEMSANLADMQSEGVGGMVEDFSSKLGETFMDHFGGLGASLDTMVSANTEYGQHMAALVERLERSATVQGAAVDQMNEAVAGAGQTIAEVRASADDLRSSSEQIKAAAEVVERTIGTQSDVMARQSQATDKLLEGMSAQAEGWTNHREALTGAYADIQSQFDGLGAAVSALTTWHESVRVALGEQIDGWNAGLETQVGLTRALGEERAGFADLVRQFSGTTDQLSALASALQGLSQRLHSEVGLLANQEEARQEGLADAALHIRAIGAELGTSFAGYVEAAKALQTGLPNIERALHDVTLVATSLQTSVEPLREVSTELRGTATLQASLRDRLVQVVQSASEIEAALAPQVKGLLAASESLAKVDRAIQTGTGNLERASAGVDRLIRSVDERDQKAREMWDRVTRSMEATTGGLVNGMQTYSQQVNSNLSTALGAFDKELKSAVSTLGAAIINLKDSVEDLDDALANVRGPR